MYKRISSKNIPMGQASAHGMSQILIEIIIAGFSYEIDLVYLYDAVRKFKGYLKLLTQALQRLAEKRLKNKRSKCKFLRKRVNVLGHIRSEIGF